MNGHEPINKFISYLGEDGSRAHKYWDFTGAWCCGEVAMVMKQTVGSLFYDGKKVVYCPTAYAWCKTHLQKIPTRNAQFGDIIFFDWNRNGVPDHIGMVEYVEGTTVHTLEGNTGSPARVRRRVRESYILGIFRPKYEPAKPQDYIVKVDGEWGYHTCLATQYVLGGLTLDGVLGKATIKAIQKKVGTTADGAWGKNTSIAMSKFLGIAEQTTRSKALISAWQKWLNSEIEKKIEPTPPTPTPTPTPQPPQPSKYSGEFPELKNIIAMEAIRCCWKYGTKWSKYRYPNGSRTAEYTRALKKAFPNGMAGRTAAAKAGAACDVFVGTVLRACGFDKEFPHGLYKDTTYLRNSKKFQKVDVTSYKDLKDGDIVHWINKTTSGHVCVAVWINGNCYQANAHAATKRYGIIDNKNKTYKPSLYKSFGVFRPVNPAAGDLRKGDYGSEVLKLQKFLTWAGFPCGTPDGSFGEKTLGSVKSFQYKVGLTADGQFGAKSLAKAKEYTK